MRGACRDVLARLTVGGPGVEVVERQRRDPGRGEVLFVLRQHHVVRRAEPMRQHDRRMRPPPGRQRQPRRASDAAAPEVDPLGRGGRRHMRLLYTYDVRVLDCFTYDVLVKGDERLREERRGELYAGTVHDR
jgi:hypothetical protein